MALTLVYTAAASNANSYCSLAEANSFFDARYHKENWEAASDDDKRAVLAWATRLLDEHCIWYGYRYSETQSLEWPRGGLVDKAGYNIDDTTIPEFLKEATAEYALWLLGEDLTKAPDTAGFKMLQAGTLRMEIDRNDRKDVLPESVWAIVSTWAEKANPKGIANTFRV